LIRAGENAKDWVPSFVDKEICEVNEEKIGCVNCGVNKEKKIGGEPGDAGDAGHGFPFVEVAGERKHEERVATDGRWERQRRDVISRTKGFAYRVRKSTKRVGEKTENQTRQSTRMQYPSGLG
jgi:hypothetical protein